MKILLDTNVIVSALVTRGLCHSIFELCLDQHTLILSEGLLQEVAEVLQKKMKIPAQGVKLTLLFLRQNSAIEDAGETKIEGCRDPDDIKVLNLAVSARVDRVVTGDKDLLVLGEIHSIPIVSPRDFWSHSCLQKGQGTVGT